MTTYCDFLFIKEYLSATNRDLVEEATFSYSKAIDIARTEIENRTGVIIENKYFISEEIIQFLVIMWCMHAFMKLIHDVTPDQFQNPTQSLREKLLSDLASYAKIRSYCTTFTEQVDKIIDNFKTKGIL